ncbi:ABC transporter ATP-binding protein [Salinibius halmophilus]|uniref:ABC transporter ATP-binding protein n=1 Tax=Salinibius halmophilus TaxID=1853216 RepID=UPI000E66F430|nr:ABC transporter ATP-binding protein [Salinibius halmophilus]
MNNILVCQDVVKTYRSGANVVSPLRGVNLTLLQGEMVAIVGASGSGKTTLLNIMAGLDIADEGKVELAGTNIVELNDNQLADLRNQNVGFVFQFHHLLAEFSAIDNVLMPIRIARKPNKEDYQNAQALLARVGLGERSEHKPSELSGGERQRVAIARALIHNPKLVFMDEPTGNLDEETSDQIHQLIMQLNESESASFVVVTHSKDLASKFDRVLSMRNGCLVEDGASE